MSQDNPYRAAGAFRGKAYIRRDADVQLLEQIEDNQYYPYFAAPRQSGKSSLLMRTMAALAPTKYRTALVDLSPFVVNAYADFWRQFLYEVARSANFDPTPIATEDPRDVFLMWLRSCKQRLIVFMDEIDVLLNVECREQIFSKFRTFFNMRARPDTAELERLQFVLAGAAHSSRFIKDPRWSPFNVAIEIELEDLSPAQVSQLSAYLATAGAFATPELTQRVHELTGGSVYLCQLLFEQLWNTAARGAKRMGAADVDAVVETIVAESPRNIHFYNIFRLVTTDARMAMLFRRLTEGQELGHEEQKELRLTGICRGANPFRNEIYARVFGPGGPLDLKVGSKQIELGKQLDAALLRRERLRSEPSDANAAQAAEEEVRRLRREFREGTALQVGDVLGRGRYRVDEKIGQGGFATVWRAFDGKAQRDVAIKVLHGQFAEDRSRRDRFFRGAWKMSELKHPGVVEVVEPYGEENGYYYFVMEFLNDGTLYSAVSEKKLSVAGILKIIAQIGHALQFAHSRGLVHRDVKPTNVLVSGEAGKLTDFDLVRETDITGGTKTGAMGTFLYAAPEVMSRPQEADVRADVYGLGMTAVFALHGEDLAMDVIRDTDRFIDRLNCAPGVHEVLKKAVAWDREHRYASPAEFVEALEKAAKPPPKRMVVPASESQRGPVAEWGGLAGDSTLLGLKKRPRAPGAPAPPASAAPAAPAPPAPSPAAAPVPAVARAPVVAGPRVVVDDEDASAIDGLAAAPAFAAMSARAESEERRPDVADSEAELDERATGEAEKRAPERRATVRATTRSARVVPALVVDDDALEALESIAAPASDAVEKAADPVSPAEVVHRPQPADEGPRAAGAVLASTAAVNVPGTRAVGESQTLVGLRGAPEATPAKQPEEPARRRLPVALLAVAASVALVFIAQSVTGPTSEQIGERDDPSAAEASSPVVPWTKGSEKRDPPRPGDSGGSAGAGSNAASAGSDDDVGASHGPPGPETKTNDSGAQEGGAQEVGEQDSGRAEAGVEPPSVSGGSTATSTAETADPADSGDPPNIAVRHPAQATLSFDELTRDGCAEVYFGSSEKGLALLMKAHDLKPKNLRMLECLGRANMGLNRYEAAERYFLRILEVESRSRKALLGAAEANEKMSRLGNAAIYYEQLRKQEPKNPSAEKFFSANPTLDFRANQGR